MFSFILCNITYVPITFEGAFIDVCTWFFSWLNVTNSKFIHGKLWQITGRQFLEMYLQYNFLLIFKTSRSVGPVEQQIKLCWPYKKMRFHDSASAKTRKNYQMLGGSISVTYTTGYWKKKREKLVKEKNKSYFTVNSKGIAIISVLINI